MPKQPVRGKIKVRRPEVNLGLCASIQSNKEEDLEVVGYVQILYGKAIKSLDVTNGKAFTNYGRIVRV